MSPRLASWAYLDEQGLQRFNVDPVVEFVLDRVQTGIAVQSVFAAPIHSLQRLHVFPACHLPF